MAVKYHLGKFPPKELDWAKLIPLIGPASAGLARYEGLLSAIPNVHVLLSPLTTQEAVLSSKIEGTHVTMGEVLEIEAGGQPDLFSQTKRDDAEEVLNYRSAMRACVSEMGQRPFSQQILRAAHGMLMKGVRGRDKNPGSYRTEPNWIGPKGCTIKEASFVPIGVEHLQTGMDDWEKYFGSTDEPDALTQLAILHVELSGYMEANRVEYQERLRAVSRDDDWTGWCAFFLKGVVQQSAENERKARAILTLYNRLKTDMVDLTHSQHSIRAVDFIFETPIFTAPLFTNYSKIPKPTAARILGLLREKKLLIPIREGKGRRAGVYVFRELVNIAEGKDVF
jgi:Fic family protein